MLWDPDWRQRIYTRVTALGYRNVLSFLDANLTRTYVCIAEMLGAGIVARQIEILEREESVAANRFERFAASCLVRFLRARVAEGWQCGPDAEFRAAHAYGTWSAAVGAVNDEATWQVWTKLKETAPSGWLPEGPDDPIIERAFAGVQFDTPDTDA